MAVYEYQYPQTCDCKLVMLTNANGDVCTHIDPVCVSIRPSFLFIDVSVIGLSERPITETSINKTDGLIEAQTGSSTHTESGSRGSSSSTT